VKNGRFGKSLLLEAIERDEDQENVAVMQQVVGEIESGILTQGACRI
jgi:hypothetical protein